ncbi:hypothetical protein N7U49_46850 [Streptomyces sp. AD2-2]|nr:hypothetical protein N7U49_46850 [Streptomyces sp. AD2-2]
MRQGGELADEFSGHSPDVRVGVGSQVVQGRFEDPVGARGAGVTLAPIAGQGMEGGDPDACIGVVCHEDEFVHRLGVDQVVEEAAAALTDGRILVSQAGADGAHRRFPAAQQFSVCRNGALRVAQA